LGLAAGLVVAACGSSSSNNPLNNLPGASNLPAANGTAGGGSLISGLSSNLDTLTSYQFSESIGASGVGLGASPGDSGTTLLITGTVINKPTQAISINNFGIQTIVIGTQQWTSMDGNSWYPADNTDPTTVTDLLPGHDYAQWFDANSTGFSVAGTETKNGVTCIHYKGSDSLGSLYAGLAGVSANFQADLWVAKDGNYPVSGVYGFFASSGGQAGSFGYSFDVTHINDPANAVTPPANVVALPS
jgi:hypothetical protein